MKKVLLLLVSASLIVSLAAPAGAVFALSEGVEEEAFVDSEYSQADNVNTIEPKEDRSLEVQLHDDLTGVKNDSLPPAAQSGRAAESELVAESDQREDIPDKIQSVVPVRTLDKRLAITYVQTAGVYGKFIEITNLSNQAYETKALTLQYIRSSDSTGNNPDILATFYGAIQPGGKIVVGNQVAQGSPDQSADIYFTQTASTVMSATGGWLVLSDGIAELDSFCWASGSGGLCGEDYYPPIPASSGAAYARCLEADRAVSCPGGLFFESVPMRQMQAGGGFKPFYNGCRGLIINEVAPRVTDQFIEIHNETDATVTLERCLLQINNRIYQFSVDNGAVEPGGYYVIDPAKIDVSLARTSAGEVRLLSSSAEIVDQIVYSAPREQRSAIMVDNSLVWTLELTPGRENRYVQYPPCEEGYWRNEATGRCNKIATPAAPTPCRDGQYRNAATGRCRNIASARQLVPCREGQYRSEETNRCRSIALAASSLIPCRDGQFRNPATNRCKKIASAEDLALADCGEGRERNPLTNRCRNILASAPPNADFAVEPITEPASVFIGWWVLGGITLAAIGYAAWEWRREIAGVIRRSLTVGRSGK